LQRPGAKAFKNTDEAIEKTAYSEAAAATIGTPDDLVARIRSVLEVSGGFGTVVGFVHDWANPENTARSWDMVARYVVPEINGYLAGLRRSQHFVATERAVFDRAKEAIMAKVYENEAAVAALAVTRGSRLGDVASASNAPDLEQARLDKARGDQEARGQAAAE
jgi:limonene 1,2-monooxygenase